MFSISEETKIKRRNRWLNGFNIGRGTAIGLIVLSSSILMGGAFTVLLSDGGKITQWAKLIPEWMQFIEIKDVTILSEMTPEINFIFYAALIFAIVATIITICMLCMMHTSAKEVGENNCKSGILDSLNKKENQTISWLDGKGTPKDPVYVVLKEEYPNGCVVQSKMGKKIMTLTRPVEANGGGYEYEVVKYQNTAKPEITQDGCRADFFKKGDTREDVTVYSFGPDTLIELSGLVFDPHQKQPKERNRSAA
ncbi:hypothetical protein [Wolbachia endosymbiont of Folsomia candida]|uniref:hypothetical protein n=1 Tax=Wolbachia endosymbiont of Folsomia candida TaxID=169402 RepID=UPI000B13F839|nr:hypothetical protein [Wolbachia endosymbiont of Folsomia candida]APR98233.1 hypothetical protein ASM33_02925 [Wolbachia endosymbiont of Folsomia candida]